MLYWGDIGLYFSPMLSFLHTQLQAGRLPLWNPWILCGTPFVGNPQTWPLYPFSVFLRAMSAPEFINWTVIFHVWLAAVGTYFFLRRVGKHAILPALFGAIVFAFGGQLVSKEQFPNMIQAAAYLPWVLWMTERLISRHRNRDALLLGLILGLQLLAAHAQIVLLTLYLASAYGVWILKRNGRRPAQEWRQFAARVVLTGAVAAGLAAGQIVPTLELFRDAARQRLSFSVVDRFYLPANQLGNFVLPTLHGHPLYGDFAARGNFWETCCFVGWVGFCLAALGIVIAIRLPSARFERFWAGVALVGLLLALGGQDWHGARAVNGLYWIAYHVLPGFRNFHDPARCLLWTNFAMSLLAARGLAGIEAGWKTLPGPRFVPGLLVSMCFVELLHFGRSLYPLADPATLHPSTPTVALLQADPAFRAHQARFLAPDTARVWERFTGHRSYRQDTPNYQSLWVSTLTPNLMMDYALPDAYGYEPVARADSQTIAGTAEQSFGAHAKPWERAAATTWAGFLSVRDVATLRVHPPESELPGLSPLASTSTLPPPGKSADMARSYLSRNTRWQPRARLMTDFRAAATEHQALLLMTHALLNPRRLDLGTVAILVGHVPFPSMPGQATEATIVEDEPDRVEVTAVTTTPTVLVLADTRNPGWQAMVNGHPAPLLTADACLKAVSLPRMGKNDIVFVDRPMSFRFGLYFTLLTFGALCGSGGGYFLLLVRKNPGRRQEFDDAVAN